VTTASVRGRLLVVDDDAAVVEFLVEELAREGFEARGATSGREALDALEAAAYDLVIADVEMPGMRGPELLAELQRRRPRLPVILITGFGSIELAVQTVRAGATDFLAKPFTTSALVIAVDRALRDRQMRREIVRLRRELTGESGEIVAQSERMRAVVDLARRVSRSDSTVFLTGESGVGKGVLARFIHRASARAAGPFVQVNCGALPSGLVESELFGVRRGAFTDARENRDGAFVQASSGTLFLDEIGEMPAEAQTALLHVLESAMIRPVGGERDLPVDVRVIAATNRPTDEALREKKLRADLYFRLNVIRLDVPPLRERRDDIPALVEYFLERSGARIGRDILGVGEDAMRWLLSYQWPGNVRELANVIERAVVLGDSEILGLEDLVEPGGLLPAAGEFVGAAASRGLTLSQVEVAYIRSVIDACGGNVTRAATVLGIDRRTVYRRLGESDGGETRSD
jgi:DNA-binding NtrC family response regulator